MYTPDKMQTALGKKRFAKIADYSFSCGVIDIAFKEPWIHPSYFETVFTLSPFYHGYTRQQTIQEIKNFIDNLDCNQSLWDESQRGVWI